MTFFDDVGAFHAKFELPHAEDGGPPEPLSMSDLTFRIGFMLEELTEFARAASQNDLPKMLDALVDLTYVALGTAHLKRLPFNEAWAEVQRANLAKERAASADDARSARGHRLDVVKPVGWKPPDIETVIERRRRGLRLRPCECVDITCDHPDGNVPTGRYCVFLKKAAE